ncbi:hypothetical protein F3Y22_tig00002511pilonHSYRG00364 [Hibiscus syriacus]|uniref:Retrovirus-related Pol polyprotein from transposon TNT 1-94-like beta-barrel domain-containing protein n=1 Tax=Hibiscus syriacus TaxID=106335 RepID=A0A6A3CWZ8_HIBSY|nr:hypothetical protein F3Y22_tig00002511pilonHSYRG00364 [Hibiscus syriacus]
MRGMEKLNHMYASRSRMRAMQLKEEINLIQKGNRSIPEYLHAVKALAYEIALIDHPISDDDLALYILNGLGSDFREIATPIRAREKSLTLEELHDLLVGHDNYLRRLESATQHLVVSANYTNRKQTSGNPSQKHHDKHSGFSRNQGQNKDNRPNTKYIGQPNSNQKRYLPKCQLCDQIGHTTKFCPQLNSNVVTANCTSASHVTENKWLMDSTASHNITGDLNNLSIHSEYDGTDEVVLGDGSGLVVAHIRSLTLKSPQKTFILNDTLYVPSLSKNLIFVHHFTSQNNVLVEFHPSHFLVKDKSTGVTLLRGACENGVYIFPETLAVSPKVANVHERTSLVGWHKCLGHLSSKIVHNVVRNFSLPVTTNKESFYVLPAPSIKLINNPLLLIVY